MCEHLLTQVRALGTPWWLLGTRVAEGSCAIHHGPWPAADADFRMRPCCLVTMGHLLHGGKLSFHLPLSRAPLQRDGVE